MQEQALGASERVDLAVHDLLPTSPLFRDEAGSLENGHVFLDRCEADVVRARERRDRLLFANHALHDVTSRGISQRVEDQVDLVVGDFLYNHLVVR